MITNPLINNLRPFSHLKPILELQKEARNCRASIESKKKFLIQSIKIRKSPVIK